MRNVSTYFVHKQNSKGELVLDALTRTEEIAKKAHEETGVPVIPEDFRHIGSSSAKLMKLMYQSDDYFSDRQSLVEEQVDTYLGFAEKVREQLPKGMRARNLQNTYSIPKRRDLHVLMHWLDNFAPSNTDLCMISTTNDPVLAFPFLTTATPHLLLVVHQFKSHRPIMLVYHFSFAVRGWLLAVYSRPTPNSHLVRILL